MEKNLIKLNSHERIGNLHINLQGHFGVDTAMELTSHINKVYNGDGNIFIHTSGITSISDQSKMMFSNMLGIMNLPKKKIYFLGEKGKEICHSEGKVIVRKGHKSKGRICGRCKNCKCKSNERKVGLQ